MTLLQDVWNFVFIHDPDSLWGFLLVHDRDYRQFMDDLGVYLRNIAEVLA